jgi:adenosylcobinamide-GDP ribazoletransferase
LVLGAIAAAVAFGLGRWPAPAMISSIVLVVMLLSFSGAMHMDGLSDTADGFLSSRPRDRILEIMKDSHVGSMGVVAIVCLLLAKFAAIQSLSEMRLWRTLFLMPLAGRCMMVVQMALLPYARPSGLGTVFYRRGRHRARCR